MHKQIAGVVAAVTGEFVDVMERVTPVIAPLKSGALQLRRQGGQIVALARYGIVLVLWIVDDRRVGADQHQVVRGRRYRHLREVVIAHSVVLGITEVIWDVIAAAPAFTAAPICGQQRAPRWWLIGGSETE